jgi:hypothetical protein
MKRHGSEAPLPFHSLHCTNAMFSSGIVSISGNALLNPRALRFLGFNKIVQLIVLRPHSSFDAAGTFDSGVDR